MLSKDGETNSYLGGQEKDSWPGVLAHACNPKAQGAKAGQL